MTTKQYITIQRELMLKHNIDKIATEDVKLFNIICKDIKYIELNTLSLAIFTMLTDDFLTTVDYNYNVANKIHLN